jgi:hypothetical protein
MSITDSTALDRLLIGAVLLLFVLAFGLPVVASLHETERLQRVASEIR